MLSLAARQPVTGRTRSGRAAGLVVLCLVTGGLAVASLLLGSGSAGPSEALDLLLGRPVENSWIFSGHRIPRTLLALIVGAGLAVAGLLMQALTRNPLADPGLLGVNAGAAAAVATSIAIFGVSTVSGYIWFAFAGAAATSVLVYVLGSQGRSSATPDRLVLAGAALSAVLTAYSGALVLTSEAAFDEFRFWQVGALANRDLGVFYAVAPFIGIGLVMGVAVAWPLNALALGDDVGRALGANVGSTRLTGALAVTLLCGACTAAAGPIAFLGLAVPHVVRGVLGPDLRWLVPYCLLGGAATLTFADVLGRVIAGQGEVEVGIMTAVIGAPLFVAIVRRRRLGRL